MSCNGLNGCPPKVLNTSYMLEPVNMTSHYKNVITILERKRVSCSIQVDLKCNHRGPSKRETEGVLTETDTH